MKKRNILVAATGITLLAGMLFAQGSNETSTSAASAETTPRIVYYVQPPANYKPTDAETLADIKQKILDDIGVEVDYVLAPVDPTEYKNKLNLMLAGGEQVDLFYTNGWEELQKDGVLADLTEPIKAYPDLVKEFGNAMGGVKTSDGHIWGIPRNADAVHYPVWLRKDWLDKLGLAVPTTMEEYVNVLKAFKEADLAGYGKTIPLLTSLETISPCFLGAYEKDGNGIYADPNGKYYPFFMSPGYKTLLETMHDWYQKGYIDKETFIYTDSQRIDLIRSGRVGSVALWFSRVTFSEPILQQIYPEASFVKCYLKGPAGWNQTVNAYARLPIGLSNTIGTSAYVISSRSKNVDACLKFLNWGFTNISNYLTSRYGLENKGWKWADKEKGIFDLIVPQTGDEYCAFKGLVTEMKARERVSPNERHVQYIYGGEITDFHDTKYPDDGGMHFDTQKFYDVAPNFADVLRIYQEESVKFIIGTRPFSEYDDFINSMKQAGMEKVADEITRQYTEMKKNK